MLPGCAALSRVGGRSIGSFYGSALAVCQGTQVPTGLLVWRLGCLGAGWWQITRAMDDNALSCLDTYDDRLARLGDRGPKAWHNT